MNPGRPPSFLERHKSAYRWGSACTILAVVAAGLFVALPSRETPRRTSETLVDDPSLAPALIQLLSPPADGPEPDARQIVSELVALGPAALPLEIAILCGEFGMPETAPGHGDQPVHAVALEKRHAWLREALRTLPSNEVLEALGNYAEPSTPLDVRLVLARLAGSTPSEDALRALLGIAGEIPSEHLSRPYVSGQIEDALGGCIEHAPGAAEVLTSERERIEPALWPIVARAAAQSRSPRMPSLLVALLGRDAELDRTVLESLARFAERGAALFVEDELVELRRAQEYGEPPIQRAAALVLGRLRDRSSALTWIGLLTHEDALLADTARSALQELAGTVVGEEPEAWDAWIAQEDAWWDSAWERLDEQLFSGDAGRAFAAVKEYLEHPAFSREAGAALADAVLDENPAIASAVVEALPRLGAAHAVPGLVRALERDDAIVDTAARSLATLTALDVPPEAQAWRDALGLDAAHHD